MPCDHFACVRSAPQRQARCYFTDHYARRYEQARSEIAFPSGKADEADKADRSAIALIDGLT